MAIDTYEFGTVKSRLETYEWDDIWWDHAPDANARRILIIGDSISRGYRRMIRKTDGCGFFVDGIATSKAVDSATFRTLVDYFAESGLTYDAVFFNNGLHGWHIDDVKFGELFLDFAKYIKEKFEPKKFFTVTTTPARKSQNTDAFDERNERVKIRNAEIRAAADALDAEVVDFYSLIENHPELYTQDGIHLIDDGYGILAKEILEAL